MFLAYDQGMEHGPVEFNDKNVSPEKIIEIAKKGKYTGIIVGKGIAEKYNNEIKKSGVPLILKLNGKTNLYKGEPMSEQLCSVKEALKLGAKAVGYTIYLGSEYEHQMLKEFEEIEREAHALGLPVIAWVYPKHGLNKKGIMAYAARVALEIGADIAKIKLTNLKELKWAVKSAGKCKIVVAGGEKIPEKEFLNEAKEIMKSGVSGMAVGRNVWKAKNPIDVSKRLRKIIFK
jgi:class I fructose-bisphosphate aldolase